MGFRPFVYKLARRFGLNGWVNNSLDGVHVEFNASPEVAREFYRQLPAQAPALSVITGHRMTETNDQVFHGFQIVHSGESGRPNLLMTPDFAVCEDCRWELLSFSDRRYRYPFITCTNCGPRFSIIRRLPYDRERTTMDVFPMCPACAREYGDPLDRRYFSQTNSCEVCGIHLSLFSPGPRLITQDGEEAIRLLTDALKEGRAAAVKGIGGYLLLCDATNPGAIREMRRRKQRLAKPFAVMYPDITALEVDAFLFDEDKKALAGPAAPILLLNLRPEIVSSLDIEGVAPGLNRIGAMLPYTPLYELIMRAMGRPVVATSGNVSGAPIVFQDEKALTDLFQIADLILTNDRDIALPQDDSVIRHSSLTRSRIVLRRSRGVAPTHLQEGLELPTTTVLSMGALLKSTFTLLHQQNTYVSQYLGKLDYFDTQQNYRHTLNHFLGMLAAKPEVVVVDKHPGYFSTQLGEELAARWEVPLVRMQHHEAHFYAVLAENRLLNTEEKVLGVIWDGTGMGNDGHIWGGEFFLYNKTNAVRLCHFEYFPFLLGDKMPKEPRISALAATLPLPGAAALLKSKFSDLEWRNYQILAGRTKLRTSSVGRLFDAVASILGLADRTSYEGEAAMRLERFGQDYIKSNGPDFSGSYLNEQDIKDTIPITLLLSKVIDDLQNGLGRDFIAAKFHNSLAEVVKVIALRYNLQKIAFSGGVFQNELLVDLIRLRLGQEYELYFHRNLSPNDECVSYGKLIGYLMQQAHQVENKVI